MSTPGKRQIEAAFGQRVYEYTDPEGRIYYSFSRHDVTLSTPVRLRLKSRIGTNLVNFLVRLRRLGDALGVDADVDG